MKFAAYLGGLLGLALMVTLVVRADLVAMLQMMRLAGWALLWLVPYRALYYFLYAVGWYELLRPYDAGRRASLSYVFWVTTVRDAIDRLLPVASVGGGVAGIRLLRWRGVAAVPAAVTVIVEVLLTVFVMYLFTAAGLMLLAGFSAPDLQYRHLLYAFVLSLPVPVVTALLLRYGSIFRRLHGWLRPLVGAGAVAAGAESLDREIRACLLRGRALLGAGALQLAAFVSGSFEIWLALRLFGHPVDATAALVLESLIQAMRHLAFMVPAGLGVQEAALMIFGHVLGISGEFALAVSMAKRMREVLCGLPALASWQWAEGRRLRRPARDPS